MIRWRELALGAAGAILGIAACVSDESVDLDAAKDAGLDAAADGEGGGGGGGGNGTAPIVRVTGDEHPSTPGGANHGAPDPTYCGELGNAPAPTCPAVTEAADPTCGPKQQCCPGEGQVCVPKGTDCPRSAPAFECFLSTECGAQGDCCIDAVPTAGPDPDCNEDQTMLVPDNRGSTCSCAAGATRLCNDDAECRGKKCNKVRVVIPNPTGKGDFVRRIGVCQ